jgi:hypothetical protein
MKLISFMNLHNSNSNVSNCIKEVLKHIFTNLNLILNFFALVQISHVNWLFLFF